MLAMVSFSVITLMFVISTASPLNDVPLPKDFLYDYELPRQQRRSSCYLPKSLIGQWAYTYPLIPEVTFRKNTLSVELALGPGIGQTIPADMTCTWSHGDTYLFTGNVMGYDLSMCLEVTPSGKGYQVARKNRGDIGPFQCCGKDISPAEACKDNKKIFPDFLMRQ